MTNFSLKSAFLSILFIAISFSTIAQNNEDNRMKIRLGFTSVNNIHRQILVTVDENTTTGIDFGYDAENFENHQDDMYWMIEERKFTIQGIDDINKDSILFIGLHTARDGFNIISIDALENVPEALEIVVFDNETGTYHNIKDNSGFRVNLLAGSYTNRFELRFIDLSDNESSEDVADEETEDVETNEQAETEQEPISETEVVIEEEVKIEDAKIELKFINNSRSITINNPAALAITSVQVYSFTGQLKGQFESIEKTNKTIIQTNNLTAGHYIIVVNTNLGATSKKILVN